MTHRHSTTPQSAGKTQLRAATTLLAFALVFLLLPALGHAQSKPRLNEVNDRLIRVENILDQSLLDLLQQIQKLEREIRFLRGEVESQANEIARLKSRQAGNTDGIELRLEELEGRLDDALDSGALGGTIGAGGDANGAELLIPDPSDETASARNDVGGGDEIVATDDETEAYRSAYDLLEADRYDESITGFETFLERYPASPYADNALYWQGEAMYAKRSFEDAIINFNVLIESFGQSPKVPDAKLKIAFALYEQSRFDDARVMLEALTGEYDGRAAAILAQKRLDEMESRGL